MRKILAIALLCSMIFSVFGCSKKNSSSTLLDEDRWNNLNYDNDDDTDKPTRNEVKDEGDVGEDDVASQRTIEPIRSLPNYPEFERIAKEIDPDLDILVGDRQLPMVEEPLNYDLVSASKRNYGTKWSILYFDSEAEAKEYFLVFLKSVETDVYDEIPFGDYYYKDNGNNGYIIFDVSSADNGGFFSNGHYYYGGVFYCGDRYMDICFHSESPFKNSEKDEIDRILTAYGLPTPRE